MIDINEVRAADKRKIQNPDQGNFLMTVELHLWSAYRLRLDNLVALQSSYLDFIFNVADANHKTIPGLIVQLSSSRFHEPRPVFEVRFHKEAVPKTALDPLFRLKNSTTILDYSNDAKTICQAIGKAVAIIKAGMKEQEKKTKPKMLKLAR